MRTSLTHAVEAALRYLVQVRNYSPATVIGYQDAWKRFHEYRERAGLPDDVASFTPAAVQGYMEFLAARGNRASTICTRLTALSGTAQAMLRVCDGRGKPHLRDNPVRAVPWPTPDHAETPFLLPDELRRFLAVPRPEPQALARDILAETGIRVSEASRLDVSDVVAVGERWALAVTVKGRGTRRRRRHVPLSPALAERVRGYLAGRGFASPDAAPPGTPLLVTVSGQRMSRTALKCLMIRIGRQAGITRFAVTPHKLRHTANVVARLAERRHPEALDRWTRSRLLNHASPRSVDRYEHLLPWELFDARQAQVETLQWYLAQGSTSNGAGAGASAHDSLGRAPAP